MKKSLLVVLLVCIFVLSACGNNIIDSNESAPTDNNGDTNEDNTEDNGDEVVNNSEDDEKESEKETDESTQKNRNIIEVNEEFHVNGLDVLIESIEFKRNELDIYVRITNVSDNTLSFYPDQGAIVVGNRQIDADFWGSDGSLAGEIYSGVEKKGVLTYEVGELNADEIEDIRLMFGQVYNEDTYSAEDFAEVISLD